MLGTITASTFFEQTFPTFLYLYIQSDKITDYYRTPYYMLQHLCGEKLTPTIWKHFKYNHIPQDLWFLKVSTEFSPFYSECLPHKNFYLSGMQKCALFTLPTGLFWGPCSWRLAFFQSHTPHKFSQRQLHASSSWWWCWQTDH